jgi:hypothetical protein
MWRILAALGLTVALALFALDVPTSPVHAQFNGCTAGFCNPPVASGGGGGVCSQATSFLARTSGLSGTETTAYTNLICGMVTDGTFSLLDTLYALATNTTTTASLNLISSSFSLTTSGTCTFTADQGYTGDASSCVLATGYTPSSSGGLMTQNSASVGVCVLNSRTTGEAWVDIGVEGTFSVTGYAYIEPLDTVPAFETDVNGETFGTIANANPQGSWISSRTSSSSIIAYKNGSSFGTISDTSFPLSSNAITLMSLSGSTFTGEQVGYGFSGEGLTGTQAGNIFSRLHTFMAALGNSAC